MSINLEDPWKDSERTTLGFSVCVGIFIIAVFAFLCFVAVN